MAVLADRAKGGFPSKVDWTLKHIRLGGRNCHTTINMYYIAGHLSGKQVAKIWVCKPSHLGSIDSSFISLSVLLHQEQLIHAKS